MIKKSAQSYSGGGLILLSLILAAVLLPSCGLKVPGGLHSGTSRMVRLVIEDGEGFHASRSVIQGKAGSDIPADISLDPGYSLRGCDYEGTEISETGDGRFTCTFKDVRYDTVVSLRVNKNPYTVRYHANGGSPVKPAADPQSVSCSDAHLRINTETGIGLFSREGHTLLCWNTKADGSGVRTGLGSRTDAERNRPLDLYAIWAPWTDTALLTWERDGANITVTGADPSVRDLVIPDEIDGRPVTSVSEDAFADTDLKSAVLGPALRHVGLHAFSGSSLEEITLPDSIRDISDYAFDGCKNLSKIHINAVESPRYSGSYYASFTDKTDYLASAGGHRKLVLFSGSSARFGYDSPMLEEAFPEYSVVNMGVFAYTNALPQLDLILDHMERGDVLLHSPEFDAAKRQFCTTDSLDDKFFNMIESDYDLLARLDFRDYSGVFSAFTEFNRIRGEMDEKSYDLSPSDYDEDGNPVPSPSYNAQGDYIVYRPNAEDDAPIYELPVSYTAASFPRQRYIDPINRVYRSFTDRGVRVLFTYAPRNRRALSEESTKPEREKLDAWFRNTLDVPVISDIEESLFPGHLLYGTDNHLSTEGVYIRTKRIIRDLKGAGL